MKYDKLEKIYYKYRSKYEEIYKLRYNSESALHFDFDVLGSPAFLLINNDILNLISDIYDLNNKVNEICLTLPKLAIYRYTKMCIIDEIKITNDIERVYSTRKEISDLMGNITKKDLKGLSGIVNKYNLLINNEDVPLNSCDDVRNLYNELVLDEVVKSNKNNEPNGKYFRAEEVNVISKSGTLVHKGVIPESKIIELMNKGLLILQDDDINLLIRTAVFHYMFGYVHPFYDGNGRMSRFISSYLICKKLNVLVGYRLSYAIKNDINKYHKAFKDTNDKKNKGDLTPFVISFLGFIYNALKWIVNSLNSKLDKYEFYIEIAVNYLAKGKINEDGFKIIGILIQNEMFGDESLVIRDIAKTMEVTKATATKYLKNLEEKYPFILKETVSNKHCYNIDLDLFESME